MRETIAKILKATLPSFLTVGLLIIALVFLQPYWLVSSPPVVATATLSPTQSVTTVITSTLSYSDALQTYEGIATNVVS